MGVSLYAVGPAKIEVGRFGMEMNEAKEAFLAKCAECGVKPDSVKEQKGKVIVDLPFKRENHALLKAVANVEDLHGDLPDRYILEDHYAPPGEYVRTGSYND
jgi:hypothetical protein